MKKSISYWSFPGHLSLRDCFALAKESGFEAIELALPAGQDEITMDSSREDLLKVKELARTTGIELSSLATGLFWQYSLTAGDPAVRQKAREIARKMLEFASCLDVDTILVVPGAVDVFLDPETEVVPYDVAYQRASEAIQSLLPAAEKYRVSIGLENVWNKFLLSPLEMRDFIDGFQNPLVGAYFDVGNTLLTGYPEHWIRILGKRIKKVHLKDFRKSVGTVHGFVNLLEGDVNWPPVLEALREIGYDGYLTAEILPPYRDHRAFLYQISQAMDFILGRK